MAKIHTREKLRLEHESRCCISTIPVRKYKNYLPMWQTASTTP